MAKGKRKKGLRKHKRAVATGRVKRMAMRRALAQYAATGD